LSKSKSQAPTALGKETRLRNWFEKNNNDNNNSKKKIYICICTHMTSVKRKTSKSANACIDPI